MKSWKRQLREGTELWNQESFRMLVEKENYQYLIILEADAIKQEDMKEKIIKELQTNQEKSQNHWD